MKVLKVIKKIFLTLLCVIFLIFSVVISILLLNYNSYGVTQFEDTSLIFINGKVASENYQKGDIVFVRETVISDLKKGDEVFTYRVIDSKGSVDIVVGDVSTIYPDDDAITLKNGGSYGMKFVAGKAYKVIHNFGTYLSILESKWGFFFIILVPLFFIFLYQIYALVIEIRYGKDDVEYDLDKNAFLAGKQAKKTVTKKIAKTSSDDTKGETIKEESDDDKKETDDKKSSK